jgi:hypothetical protein
MRKLLLGSALAAVLTFGVHGTSLASPVAPAQSEVRLQPTGTILVNNINELSNQSQGDNSDNDDNGNNGNDSNGN